MGTVPIYVYSVFSGIDGEVNYYGQGRLSTFIRLQECNFDIPCTYCDSPFAQKFDKYAKTTIQQVMNEIELQGVKKVTITGGEPLLQYEAIMELTSNLASGGYLVSIETNGSVPLVGVNTTFVVDYKLNNSGMTHMMMDIDKFRLLSSKDIVKFVMSDEVDLEQAISVWKQMKRAGCIALPAFSIMFTGSIPQLDPQKVINRLLCEHLSDAYLNVQIHKLMNLP